MRGLLLVAHGSRRSASNDEVVQLGVALRERLAAQYAQVTVAFLELAMPTIAAATQTLVESGCREIRVMPYFLAAGKHVQKDLPAEIGPLLDQYPDVDFQLAPHLGAQVELLADCIEHLLEQSQTCRH